MHLVKQESIVYRNRNDRTVSDHQIFLQLVDLRFFSLVPEEQKRF